MKRKDSNMPDPGRYKNKQNWMEDCMHQTKTVEDKPQDQAVAICLNMWRNKDKKKKKAAHEILRELVSEL